jgi:hypothetical protein
MTAFFTALNALADGSGFAFAFALSSWVAALLLVDFGEPFAPVATTLSPMPPDVPKEDQPSESRLLEEREAELTERLIALSERGIPENATVTEAMLEIYRAMREEPEAQALVKQLAAMAAEGGGNVSFNWANWWRENRVQDDPEP